MRELIHVIIAVKKRDFSLDLDPRLANLRLGSTVLQYLLDSLALPRSHFPSLSPVIEIALACWNLLLVLRVDLASRSLYLDYCFKFHLV